MKYAHLVNACHNHAERAELAFLLANSALGLRVLANVPDNIPAPPFSMHVTPDGLRKEIEHLLDAVKALEALVKP